MFPVFVLLSASVIVVNIIFLKYWARLLSIIIFLCAGIVCYFGIVSSSRIAILNEKDVSGVLPKQEWIDGAISTRKVAQDWAGAANVVFISTLILALIPSGRMMILRGFRASLPKPNVNTEM